MEFDLSILSRGYYRARRASRYIVAGSSPVVLLCAIAGFVSRSSLPRTAGGIAIDTVVFGVACGLMAYGLYVSLVQMAPGADRLRVEDRLIEFSFPSGKRIEVRLDTRNPRLRFRDLRGFQRSSYPIRVFLPGHPISAIPPEALDSIERSARQMGLAVSQRVVTPIMLGRLTDIRIARR
jgi:hypothetical protein